MPEREISPVPIILFRLRCRNASTVGHSAGAYTWAKLLSNTDTITSWLEPGGKGGVQDWNNLRAEKSLSSQNVPQHLIISYVLDLPIGRNQKYLSDLSPMANKVIGGGN